MPVTAGRKKSALVVFAQAILVGLKLFEHSWIQVQGHADRKVFALANFEDFVPEMPIWTARTRTAFQRGATYPGIVNVN